MLSLLLLHLPTQRMLLAFRQKALVIVRAVVVAIAGEGGEGSGSGSGSGSVAVAVAVAAAGGAGEGDRPPHRGLMSTAMQLLRLLQADMQAIMTRRQSLKSVMLELAEGDKPVVAVVAAVEEAALSPLPLPPPSLLLLRCQLQLVQRPRLGLTRRLQCKACYTAMAVT